MLTSTKNISDVLKNYKTRVKNIIYNHYKLFWIILMVINIFLMNIFVMVHFENLSFWDAFFTVGTTLFNENYRAPESTAGKIVILSTLVMGLVSVGYIILFYFSDYLSDKIRNKNNVKIRDKYTMGNHIVICGISSKIEGILGELRSEDLDESSKLPVIIIDPDVDSHPIPNHDLRRNVYGIIGEANQPEILKSVNIEEAKAILIISPDNLHKHYSDTHVTMIYKSIENYFYEEDKYKEMTGDIHIVLELKDPHTNIHPFKKQEENKEKKGEIYHRKVVENELNIEPVHMENIPSYLFVQSILEKDMNEIIQRLLTPKFKDTNEFYYLTINKELKSWVGEIFYQLEERLLDSNSTLIGFIRRSSSGSELFINPLEGDSKIENGDILILIAYNEKDIREVKNILAKRNVDGSKGEIPLKNFRFKESIKGEGFFKEIEHIYIINWDFAQIKNILMELTRLKHEEKELYNIEKKIEVGILAKREPKYLEKGKIKLIKEINEDFDDEHIGVDKYIKLKFESFEEPLDIETLRKIGIRKDKTNETRIIILSDDRDEDENIADNRVLYQSQIIENNISKKMFTAVEVNKPKNFRFLGATNIDILISLDDLSQKVLGQTLLKPYFSLVLSHLLSFSKESNEFYIREIPKKFEGKKIIDFQKMLIGYPIIFVGHIRKHVNVERNIITINPKFKGKYEGDDFLVACRRGAEKGKLMYRKDICKDARVKKTEKFKQGDKVILIAREPSILDGVLSKISSDK